MGQGQYNIKGGGSNSFPSPEDDTELFIKGYFRIRNLTNGKALEYNNNDIKLTLENLSDKYYQQWFMYKNGRIINRFNSLNLIVTGNNNGAYITTKKMSSDLTSQWRINNTGTIVSKYNEQLITYDDTGKNKYIYTWESFEGNSQKWYFEVVDDKKWISKIVKGIQTGPLVIPNLSVRSSVNFSFFGWIRNPISNNSNSNGSNGQNIILTKGN